MRYQKNHPPPKNEKPPFFESWKGMYWLVLANLAFLIVLFYCLTLYYA